MLEKLPSGMEVPLRPPPFLTQEAASVMESHGGSSHATELPSQPSGEVKAGNHMEMVFSPRRVGDRLHRRHCAYHLLWQDQRPRVSPPRTFLRFYSMFPGLRHQQPRRRGPGKHEALRKPTKTLTCAGKKVNSQEIHMLPIKKQRLATFFQESK